MLPLPVIGYPDISIHALREESDGRQQDHGNGD